MATGIGAASAVAAVTAASEGGAYRDQNGLWASIASGIEAIRRMPRNLQEHPRPANDSARNENPDLAWARQYH